MRGHSELSVDLLTIEVVMTNWIKFIYDLNKLFLNLDDLGNVPQYPGYSGYQLVVSPHALLLKAPE